MGTLALSWSIAAVAALVAAVSAVRVMTTRGEARFAAGGDLLMGLSMAVMALPVTVAWYAEYGLWWSAAFAAMGLGGVALAVKHTRECGWAYGRHWVHLIVGSFGMVIMTLAMTSTSSGTVLALGHGHAMAGMPGMDHTGGARQAAGMEHSAAMESMPGMTAHAATAGADTSSSAIWRWVIAALALYFLLSIAASVWTRVRGAKRSATKPNSHADGRESGRRDSWARWLLTMPDTVVVYLASLSLSAWDRTRPAERGRHSGRRRRIGAAPEAALAAHIGMGGTMSAMLLMMAA
jgi:hypothetical protein